MGKDRFSGRRNVRTPNLAEWHVLWASAGAFLCKATKSFGVLQSNANIHLFDCYKLLPYIAKKETKLVFQLFD